MSFIKWALVIIGCLALLVVGAGWAVIHKFKSTPAVQMSMADLETGGRVLPGEHDALLAACHSSFDKSFGAKAPNACACLATRAEQSLSRFSRLTLTAGLNRDFGQAMAIGKGMAEAGATKEAIEAAAAHQKATLQPMIAQCLNAS